MKKNLITSSLLSVNGEPHIGHLIGCLLPSDAYARFKRLKGEETLFIGGTDEHGTATEIASKKAGKTFQKYCDELFLKHKKIYEEWNISFDELGRTSDEKNHALVKEVFKAVEANGYIEEKTTKQIYSPEDNRFLSDRYVEGTCPHCGAKGIKGDQCESCTALLDPTELIDPYSSISGSKSLEIRKTKHLYLKLSTLQPKLEEWIKSKNWNKTTQSIAEKWLTEGLQDRCITRDLEWGISVPKTGYENKVFYVWFDAPFGYISITQKWAEKNGVKWEDWWKSDNVNYVQFVAKDNIPFHTVYFPAVEMASQQNFHKVDNVNGVNYLNFEHKKISKSKGVGVMASQASEEFLIDYWRYYLLNRIPENADSNFSFEEMITMINKDLNDVLGNFVMRVLKLYIAKWGTETSKQLDLDEEVIAKLDPLVKEYQKYFENIQLRKAFETLREIWVKGNEYIAEKEPWTIYKSDEKSAKKIVETGLKLIGLFATLAKPIIPTSAEKIEKLITTDSLSFPKDTLDNWMKNWNPRTHLEAPETIFEKIDIKRLEDLQKKYGGQI